jgi:predicted nucleotidyltransferase
MKDSINIVRIRAVANTLRELNQTVVFVGGATVSLYAGKAAPEARPTDDVDVIVELASYGEYAHLEDRLRSIGFVNDTNSGVVCRHKIHSLTVDIMPTHPDALGFSNRWYPDGFKRAIPYSIDERTIINIFSLPYFIASKLEAFKARGGNDFRFSTDFEDIVYVLDNGDNVAGQLLAAEDDVKAYLKDEFTTLLENPGFEEGVLGHLDPHTAGQGLEKVIGIAKQISG